MSKRFIDTGLYDDPWFMDLSKDGKIIWIYMTTRCNHAGIIEINRKLVKMQTDVENIDTVIKELGNRILTVSKDLYFIPKFITFQYPNFPQSAVKQQKSAIELLEKIGKVNPEIQRVTQQLLNCYGNGNEYDNGNGGGVRGGKKHEDLIFPR